MEWLALFSIALAVTIVVMFVAWLWAIKVNNFALVDAVWAFCFSLHALIFFIFSIHRCRAVV